MGMTLRYNLDMFTQFYLRKAGLSVFFRPFKGKLEGRKRIEKDIKFNINKKKVAFITYNINENSVKEILKFLTEFQKKTNGIEAPCDFYCPVYWPLFEGEGSSCSSLCMAVLEAAGIYMEGREQWIEKMKVPVELIGGDLNYGKKIALRKIKRSKSWYNGNGKSDTDYVKFEVYDPVLMKNWITRIDGSNSGNGRKVNNPPRLNMDYTEVRPLDLKSVMKKRPETSLFIRSFYEKL